MEQQSLGQKMVQPNYLKVSQHVKMEHYVLKVDQVTSGDNILLMLPMLMVVYHHPSLFNGAEDVSLIEWFFIILFTFVSFFLEDSYGGYGK